MPELIEKNKKIALEALIVLSCILSAYYAVKIYSEIKKDSIIGENSSPATISFSGHGEINASPDIANINFSINKDADTVKAAQEKVATIEKAALSVLKDKGVKDKDIKTNDASFSPKYEYRQNYCAMNSYCPGKSIIVGYTANESVSVKIRNIDDAAEIIQALGSAGVSNLDGPNFTIEKQDDLKMQARQKAIDDAKTKAKELAKELGVSLGKITNFSDGNIYPVAYKTTMANAMSDVAVPAPAILPQGESTITSDVTITYEIK